MYALKDRAGPAKSLALLLCGILMGITLVGVHAVAQTNPPTKYVAMAKTAQTRCKPLLTGAPCRGSIQTGYSYSGLGSGDDTYIWAKAGREIPLGRRLKTFPPPAYYVPVSKRTFTWHAKSSVEVVAVYIVHSLPRKYTYQKVSLKKHEVTLTTNNEDPNPPLLLLEGRHKS